MNLNVRELRSGTGVPIVMLHGWMGSGADFEALVAAQHLDGRTVLAIDLPGHGDSPDSDREYGFEDVAAWVEAALPAEVVDLVGYSMGGRVALYVAGMNRTRVKRLVLIGANPGIDHPVAQRERLELDSERATKLLAEPHEFLRAWGELEMFGPRTQPAWEDVKTRRHDTAEDSAFAWSRALICLSLGRQLSLWNLPYGVTLPTLFVVGSKDGKYLAIGRELAAQNPGQVSIAIVGGGYHAAHLDQPVETARRIAEFLADEHES